MKVPHITDENTVAHYLGHFSTMMNDKELSTHASQSGLQTSIAVHVNELEDRLCHMDQKLSAGKQQVLLFYLCMKLD